jgi:hypothetical protein
MFEVIISDHIGHVATCTELLFLKMLYSMKECLCRLPFHGHFGEKCSLHLIDVMVNQG